MTIKNILITIILFMSSVIASAEEEEVGRFQLFQGQYPFVDIKGVEHWQKALFLLDTKTGDMFECRGGLYDGDIRGKKGKIIQSHDCEAFKDYLVMDKKQSS